MKSRHIGFADGSGGDGLHVLDAENTRDRPEPRQGGERPLDAVATELPAGADRAAKPTEDLFVEQRRRTADRALVDDEADGVRADIDDADRLQFAEPAAIPARAP